MKKVAACQWPDVVEGEEVWVGLLVSHEGFFVFASVELDGKLYDGLACGGVALECDGVDARDLLRLLCEALEFFGGSVVVGDGKDGVFGEAGVCGQHKVELAADADGGDDEEQGDSELKDDEGFADGIAGWRFCCGEEAGGVDAG